MKDPRHIYLEKENQGRGITLLVVSGDQITPKIESSDRDWCFYGKDQFSIRI